MKVGGSLLVLLLAARLCNAAVATNLLAKLDPVPPFPAVSAAAGTTGIPLTGIEPSTNGDALAPGDSATALVTLHEKKHRPTQWLLYFQTTTNSPAKHTEASKPMVLYTSTGGKYEFGGSPASIRIRTLGPFAEPNARRRQSAAFDDDSARVTITREFLSLGMDRGAAAVIGWVNAGRQRGGTNFMDVLDITPDPFASERTNHDRQLAAQWHVTPGQERAVVEWIPALSAYFGTVQETPKLKDMLWKVIDLPSVWSFVRNHGVKASFDIDHNAVAVLTTAGWGLPADPPVYALPATLTINNHPALKLTLLVTAPRPPLLVCGGIVGFLAENPAEAETYLTLRIVSAHYGQ